MNTNEYTVTKEPKTYYLTRKYGTLMGNRYSVETVVFKAILVGNELYNKTFVKKFETHLILKFKPTKSTEQAHQKKIEEFLKEYPEAINLGIEEIKK